MLSYKVETLHELNPPSMFGAPNMVMMNPRTQLIFPKTLPRTLLTHKEQIKPPVLYGNSRVTRTILWDGSMSWMETMDLHSVPGLVLTLKLWFTLLTLVEMAEYSLCFTHKDNTQFVIAHNYFEWKFINQPNGTSMIKRLLPYRAFLTASWGV